MDIHDLITQLEETITLESARLSTVFTKGTQIFSFSTAPREGDDGKSLAVRAAWDAKTGEPRVTRPEMIVAMLLEMATGDPNMPKGGHADEILYRDGRGRE